MVKTPMDFGTIKEKMAAGNYNSPLELCKDMRLVFCNARLYTPNKRSRVSAADLKKLPSTSFFLFCFFLLNFLLHLMCAEQIKVSSFFDNILCWVHIHKLQLHRFYLKG